MSARAAQASPREKPPRLSRPAVLESRSDRRRGGTAPAIEPDFAMKTSAIEVLESRIAPASVLSYTDIDGDKVQIKSTAGELTGHATIVGGQLQLLDLSDPGFAHANITFTVTKVSGGDGLANVGRIAAGTNDLATVTVKGDLGAIDAGSGTAGTPAVKSLSVRSMGFYGLDTQGGAGDLESDLHGALGSLKVTRDIATAYVRVFGGTFATLGSVTIGGSLIGGAADHSGELEVDGDIGAVKIGRDIQGGTGMLSGIVRAGGKLASATLGGSLLGGTAYGAAISSAVWTWGR
jgi:hypothetical protein